MVKKTANTFAFVEDQVGTIAVLFDGVAEASREQSENISRIRDSVSSMDRVSREGIDRADESARSAGELTAQAANLHGAMDGLTELVHGRSG
jgi:methyl-accepting chemotaxis protein